MKHILLVDDDPVVLLAYGEGLSRHGFQVETAMDGLAAVKALQKNPPDLMVLDLVMPKFTGVDVLKYVRGNGTLAALPVIVLSNSYAERVASEAAERGAQRGLLKTSCTPQLLANVIREILEGTPAGDHLPELLGVAAPSSAPPIQAIQPLPPERLPPQTAPPPAPAVPPTPVYESVSSQATAYARIDFLQKGTETCRALRGLFDSFQQALTEREQGVRLQDLYRKFHFLTASSEVTGCLRIARMTGALDALILGLIDKPARITPSVLHTMTMAIDFLEKLFETASPADEVPIPTAEVLVVDDDQLTNRLVVSSLHRVGIKAKSAHDPLVGLRLLASKYFDLILLDIEMPGMDGFSFCQRLRIFPGYAQTPVIFVTLHSDPETRAKTFESGGNDFITKPILPLELAVKVVMHLLKQ